MLKKSSLQNTGRECPVLILRRTRTRGVVLHMLEGQEACTEGAMIHKAVARRYGHKGGTKGAQRVRISRY